MRPFEQINVIPFIDIMLVLLAIVLTTATFIVQGRLNIELPRGEARSAFVGAPATEIAIDAEGHFYFDGSAVTEQDLPLRLQALSSTSRIDLRVDGRVAFARFVAVADALKAEQLTRISILIQDGE